MAGMKDQLMRVLVVEDNDVLSDAIADALSAANMTPTQAGTGRHAVLFISQARKFSRPYEAIVLDLTLPDIDGLEVLKRLRDAKDPTPVIVLTARSELSERVGGLSAGADDYLTKPFEMVELVARIRAIGRRAHLAEPSGAGLRPQIGNLIYDKTNGQFSVNGTALRLTPKNRVFLSQLFRNFGQPVSKELLTNLDDSGLSIEAVDGQISRLRKRLREAGAMVAIETLYGIGYKLEEVIGEVTMAPWNPSEEELRPLTFKAD